VLNTIEQAEARAAEARAAEARERWTGDVVVTPRGAAIATALRLKDQLVIIDSDGRAWVAELLRSVLEEIAAPA
jgi:uncharacterized protein YcgI (DUF1989 family)